MLLRSHTQVHRKALGPFCLHTGGEDKVVLKEFEAVVPNLDKDGMVGDKRCEVLEVCSSHLFHFKDDLSMYMEVRYD